MCADPVDHGTGIPRVTRRGPGPLVSVVIAVRNGERFVAQAIESVLLQTYHRVETIVVENASTDGTVEILAGFRDRIRVIHRRQPGLSAARNAGIEASSGELVAFLDADDLWMPGKLDRQVEVFMGDPSCAFVFGEVFAIDARNAIVGHWRKRDLGRPVADRFLDLYEGNYIHVPTVVVRRKCLREVGGFREDLDTTEDYDLWLRLARRFEFRYIDEPLALYRVHPAQFTQDIAKFERRIRNNVQVLTTPPVAAGMSRLRKRIRVAKVYTQYARLYARHGRDRQALATFLRALRTWPFAAQPLRALGSVSRRVIWRGLRLPLNAAARLAGIRITIARVRIPVLPRPAADACQRTICVAVPLLGVPSETFVRNHVAGLLARVVVLHAGWPPERLADGRSVGDLPRFLRRNRINAVLAEHGQTGACLVAPCRAAGVPLVVHFHGADAFDRDILNAHEHSYRDLFREAARVVVVSRAMARQLEMLGCDPGKIRRVPCGVDLSLLRPVRPGANPPVLCAVGRFVDKKAPHLTILAFARALRTVLEARLVMAGDGPLLEACRKLAHALGVSASVTFVGAAMHPQVVEILARSRAFVQHSVTTGSGDREGLPVAVLEACASGLPVIATSHSGIIEVITDGQNGLLVEELDSEGMAGRMIQVCSDPQLADRLGGAARATAEQHFGLKETLRDLNTVLEEAMRVS